MAVVIGPEHDDVIVTLLAEWEGLVGTTLVEALAAGTGRALAGDPYALTEMVEQQRIEIENLRDAFRSVTEDRNMWRSRAKRAANVARGRE